MQWLHDGANALAIFGVIVLCILAACGLAAVLGQPDDDDMDDWGNPL